MSSDKDLEMTTRDHGNVNGPEYRDNPDPVLGYAGGDRHVSASGMPVCSRRGQARICVC